ncbi:MAG: ATP-binding protein [Lachnospiraceae bacterium]|nr:ATP-binding protein [Lachnospiraceae bacterium]
MTTGKELLTILSDELKDLGLHDMAESLDIMYHSPDFLMMDHLSLLEKMISAEYEAKISKRINNRLKNAHLNGCPQEINQCRDSQNREYIPTGIIPALSSLDFIQAGQNVCILGPSDSGKSYLAKAIGIKACTNYRVGYYHCETFLEDMVALKQRDYQKYIRKIKSHVRLDLLILDDFLLHTITDEREIKVLFDIMEKRSEASVSTIVCSQREPKSWKSMILNDEVSANSIMKRATKHYTVIINSKGTD